MRENKLKQNKGVAGMELLVGVIATLFVIGMLIMAFTLAGNKMQEKGITYTTTAVTNETLTTLSTTGDLLSHSGTYGVACSVGLVTNQTNGVLIPSNNYTQYGTGNCGLKASSTANPDYGKNVNVSYTYRYPDETPARAINNTTQAISSVTEWFSTFIVIMAVVVLVLLILLVINAVKGSGLMGSGGA